MSPPSLLPLPTLAKLIADYIELWNQRYFAEKALIEIQALSLEKYPMKQEEDLSDFYPFTLGKIAGVAFLGLKQSRGSR